MLNLYQVDAKNITLNDLEELAEDESVYSVFYFSGWKTNDKHYEVPAGYRIKSFGEFFKNCTLLRKKAILDNVRDGEVLLVWLFENQEGKEDPGLAMGV